MHQTGSYYNIYLTLSRWIEVWCCGSTTDRYIPIREILPINGDSIDCELEFVPCKTKAEARTQFSIYAQYNSYGSYSDVVLYNGSGREIKRIPLPRRYRPYFENDAYYGFHVIY
jgi:hypothetical protein